MPYIERRQRLKIDAFIEGAAHNCDNAGELNYAVTKLCHQFLADLNGRVGYAELNEVIGVLEAAKLEFFRETVGPYEQGKLERNGPITVKPPKLRANL